MAIHRKFGLEGASAAVGATVVVDTFRAFTTAAFAHAGGVGVHILVATLDEARSLKSEEPSALLCGEDMGVKPEDFDLGNSPAELLHVDLEGRTLIQRTSAGTRCVLAALGSPTVESVSPASLVTATATANAFQSASEISLVASGRYGSEPAIEDELTCDFLEARIKGNPTPKGVRDRIAQSESAHRLQASPWAHPDDLELCCDIDRFAFFLSAIRHPDGYALVHKTPI